MRVDEDYDGPGFEKIIKTRRMNGKMPGRSNVAAHAASKMTAVDAARCRRIGDTILGIRNRRLKRVR